MTSGGRVTPCCDPPTGPDVVYWAACDAIFFSSSSFSGWKLAQTALDFPPMQKGASFNLHGLARSADHLPDLFVSQVQFHLVGFVAATFWSGHPTIALAESKSMRSRISRHVPA
jgi:hypothetical protein